MKYLYTLLSVLVVSLGLTATTGFAQCSGQFVLVYPSGAGSVSQTVTNGTGSFSSAYCPSGASASSQIEVTPSSNTVSILYRGQGTDTVRIEKHYILINNTYVFALPINSASTTYTLRNDISKSSCNNAKTNLVTLNLAPSLSVSASQNGAPLSSAVCPGSAVTLTATGASTNSVYYLRNSNSSTVLAQNTTGVFEITPTASATYSVTTNTTACGSADVVQQIVVNTNNISLNSNATNNNVSTGGAVTLTATGGSGTTTGYTWTAYDGTTTTTLPATGSTIMQTPVRTTQYTVTGTTATGNCASSASLVVRVNNGPLPVELVGFTAKWAGKGVLVSWSTASEKNNAYFEVQRSLDGTTFDVLQKRAGAGTTSSLSTYQFTDASVAQLATGLAYYRLRQVDINGRATYSAVQVVRVPVAAQVLKANVFPNPSSQAITLQLTAEQAGEVAIAVRGVLGQVMLTKTVMATAGTQEIGLPQAAAWPAGVYYLTIRQGTQQQVVKVSRQ